MKERVSFKGIRELIKVTFIGFSEDKITKHSAALAYYTVFSMGPLLVVIVSFCGLFLKRETVEGQLYTILRDFVGSDTAMQLQKIIKNAAVSNHSTLTAVIGVIVLLIGATSVFAVIQESINSIWGLKPKPKHGWLKLLTNRVLSFSIIVTLGFLLLVSLVVTGLVEMLSRRLQASFPDIAIVIFYILNLILTLTFSTLIFAMIFKVLPDAKIKWKDVLAGSFVTACLFLLGKFGISLYISKVSVGSTYGAAGSLVVLLVWVYYSSIILYLGAEFTKAYALKYGGRIYPNDYAVTIKEMVQETGREPIQQKDALSSS